MASSTPGTPRMPAAGSSNANDADPLLTIRAARQHSATPDQSMDDEDDGTHGLLLAGQSQQPASFKRRMPSTSTGSPLGRGAAPVASTSKRGFSNLFSRGPVSRSGRDQAPSHVPMPESPNLLTPEDAGGVTGGLRSPSRRMGRDLLKRTAHEARRSVSQSTLGRRIEEWQQRAVSSPAATDDMDLSPGSIDDGEEPVRPEDLEYPRMLPGIKTPQYQTPLPKIPIIVLAICMLGEFLSASVGQPFLFFMLEDLGVPGGGGESAVGLWAGIVSASFFLSQFLTALVWSSLSVKIGRRQVLLISLTGNSCMLLAYGVCQNVPSMVFIRLLQGAFNGSVGVARGAVKDITDASNEGRAYSVIGLCWSLGGIVGPMIGGWLEHPVENLPNLFGSSDLLRRFPYLLPTATAASVTATGALLCLFLSYDGGPREGGIRLPEEKDVEHAIEAVASLPGTVKKKMSGYFGSNDAGTVNGQALHGTPQQVGATSPLRLDTTATNRYSNRQVSRGSFRLPAQGSAYGYNRRDTGLSRYRKMSMAASTRYAPDYDGGEVTEGPSLNLAQRLLLANDEAAVFNISDIWIAAATRDEALPYQPGDLEEDPFDEDEDDANVQTGNDDPFAESGIQSAAGGVPASSKPRQQSMGQSTAVGRRRVSPLKNVMNGAVSRGRAGSVISTMSRPAIYNNTGLARSPITSPAIKANVSGQQQYFDLPRQSHSVATQQNGLAAIPEGKPAKTNNQLLTVPGAEIQPISADESMQEAKTVPFSIWRDLPVGLIAQWTILALHGTIMDQVFMSYLVTKSGAGGLGLEASDFADVIAIMCIFQMLFQFRFYPAVSLPAGSLTHLQMFRLGLVFYLVTYIFFPELRPLQGPGGTPTFSFQFGLILLTAIRYLATTCAYTAIMILVNAMTHPDYVPLANGLAQSTVSLARFVGPLSGGIIWSRSIADSPEGYYIGFAVVSCICATGLIFSFAIR